MPLYVAYSHLIPSICLETSQRDIMQWDKWPLQLRKADYIMLSHIVRLDVRGVFKIASIDMKPLKRKKRAMSEASLLATYWDVSFVCDHVFFFDFSSPLVSYCGCHSDLIFILSQNIWPLPWLPYILLFALPAMLWVSHIIIHKHMCGMDAFCCPVKAMPLCCFICHDTIRVIFKFHCAKTGITYLRMIKDSLWHNNQSA